MKSTIENLANIIEETPTILIGAGAGLSTAAGFQYGGEAFLKNFPEMVEKYGYTDMYSAGFHPFTSEEEKWGYWSKFIYLNRYKDGAKQLYQELLELVKDKNYFVLTTNVDHQFQLAGFDKSRLFYTQGDYGLLQCAKPCHQKTYDNEELVKAMVQEQKKGIIPSYLVPKCPICGGRMETNLRADDAFVEDEGWQKAATRYQEFLEANEGKPILFLELGVGFNTPGIIKYPFIRMALRNKNAIYACINKGEVYSYPEIEKRSLLLDMDLKEAIEDLLKMKKKY